MSGTTIGQFVGYLSLFITFINLLNGVPSKHELTAPVSVVATQPIKVVTPQPVEVVVPEPVEIVSPRPIEVHVVEVEPPDVAPLEIGSVQTFCKGCPSDHVTFFVTLKNNSDRTIEVGDVTFNPSVHRITDVPHPRQGRQLGTILVDHSHQWHTSLDLPSLVVGSPIPLDLRVSLPPHEQRPCNISIGYHGLSENDLWYTLLSGTLTFRCESGEVSQPIEVIGPSSEVAQ